MKKLATRIAVIATVAFSIFLGGGGLGPQEADARYRHIQDCELEEVGGWTSNNPGEPNTNPDC